MELVETKFLPGEILTFVLLPHNGWISGLKADFALRGGCLPRPNAARGPGRHVRRNPVMVQFTDGLPDSG